jgi:hypothetical protein
MSPAEFEVGGKKKDRKIMPRVGLESIDMRKIVKNFMN